MEIKQLSKNGFRLCNVFDKDFLVELVNLTDTFIPDKIQFPGDSPELLTPKPGAVREVLHLPMGEIKKRILSHFDFSLKTPAIEIWRDYPGYRNLIHFDAENVKNVIIVYLDSYGDGVMGTKYYEDNNEYFVEYQKNDGLMLYNSSKILHHMIGEVENVAYRKALYINWNDE